MQISHNYPPYRYVNFGIKIVLGVATPVPKNSVLHEGSAGGVEKHFYIQVALSYAK